MASAAAVSRRRAPPPPRCVRWYPASSARGAPRVVRFGSSCSGALGLAGRRPVCLAAGCAAPALYSGQSQPVSTSLRCLIGLNALFDVRSNHHLRFQLCASFTRPSRGVSPFAKIVWRWARRLATTLQPIKSPRRRAPRLASILSCLPLLALLPLCSGSGGAVWSSFPAVSLAVSRLGVACRTSKFLGFIVLESNSRVCRFVPAGFLVVVDVKAARLFVAQLLRRSAPPAFVPFWLALAPLARLLARSLRFFGLAPCLFCTPRRSPVVDYPKQPILVALPGAHVRVTSRPAHCPRPLRHLRSTSCVELTAARLLLPLVFPCQRVASSAGSLCRSNLHRRCDVRTQRADRASHSRVQLHQVS